MRAKNLIIVTSGSARVANASELDSWIRTANRRGLAPIVVLGPDGDEFLRACSEIEKSEIVFDPNFEGGFFSGLKAGLFAIGQASYVIDLGQPCLETELWPQLEARLFDGGRPIEGTIQVLRPVTHDNATLFPQLITHSGAESLKALPASTDWTTSDAIVRMDVAIESACAKNASAS